MKQIAFFTILFALASANSANGQLRHWGLKAALTSADVDYQNKYAPELETNRRIGFGLGVYTEWIETGWFTLVTQAEYVQKGMGMDFLVTGPESPEALERKTLYSRLDYLSVPILGKATLPVGALSPYVLAGPRVDIFLGYQSDENGFHALFDKYEKTAFGATVGAGLQIDSVFPVPIMLEARYNLDITKSFENDVIHASNNTVDLWLGVAL